MSSPKYSFVIPVLNGERTLSQCLSSILDQTFPSFEVIVIDNGSTDRTAQIIGQFPSVLRVYEARRGRSIARNRGIQVARGEFVAFVDCDVVLDREWLQNMDLELKNFPLDVLGSRIIPSRAPKNFLNNYRFILKRWETNGLFLNVNFRDATWPTLNTAAGIVSRKSLLQVGGFKEEYKRCEDTDLANRLFSKSYLFGGTTKARAKVFYEFSGPTFLQLRPLRYLYRIFRNTLYLPDTNPRVSLKLPKNYQLTKRLFFEKKYALSFFSFLYALMIFLGRNISAPFKEKYSILRLESGHHELLGQFSWDSKTYGLRKGVRFFVLNENIYLIDEIQIKYVKLSHNVRDALLRVFKHESLTAEDVSVLEGTQFFYSF